jgi:hypothetical protein
MARKFLYLVAGLVVLIVAAALALSFWSEDLSEFAFVPEGAFTPQPELAANVYAQPSMWISRPGLGAKDPARWLPQGARPAPQRLGAAVFFIHPTSYLGNAHWNASLTDRTSRRRADLFVRGMASPFNASQDLWAPRYRQAAFGAFLTDAPQAKQALDLAYDDVSQAFEYFLAHTDKAEPIVLAGHSQGAFLLKRLIRDHVAGKPLARRIAVVYAVGWPVSLDQDLTRMGLPACAAPDQAGCVMSWLSFADPADPGMVRKAYARHPGFDESVEGGPFLCSNPLTGTAGGAAPASADLGTLVPDLSAGTGKLVPGMVPARCRKDGLLDIGEPPDLGPYVLPGNNYHIYDIPLFWANLRQDVARRVGAWRDRR